MNIESYPLFDDGSSILRPAETDPATRCWCCLAREDDLVMVLGRPYCDHCRASGCAG